MLRRLLNADGAIVAGVTLLALLLRAWQIDAIPPGLHYDEAFHALAAREMIRTGIVPAFLEGNFGVPPLFAFLVSLSFRLFGQTPLAERLVSVAAGTLTVPVLYLLAREVLGSRRVALLSALLLAISFQGIVFSREGLEPHLVPLILSAGMYLLWRGWRTRGWPAFAAAGLVLGLGFFSYQAYWLSPLIVAPVAIWRLLVERGGPPGLWRRLIVCAALAAAVAAPLAPHVLSQVAPGSRLAQIATTSPEAEQSGLAALANNAGAVAAMFCFRGDPDPRNNLPGRPMLDPFLSLGFAGGVLVCLRRWRRPGHGLWLVWLVVMSLPVALSEFAPHFRRAIGLLPAVTVLTALGLDAIWDAFRGSRLPAVLGRQVAPAVIVLGLAASAVAAGRDYFVLLGPTNEFYYAFDTGLTDMARYANTLPSSDRVYYLPADNRHTTLQFLATRPVPRSFESRQVFVLPPMDQRDTVYIAVTMEDAGALPTLRQTFPSGRVVHEGRDREGGVYFTAFRVPAGARAAVAPGTAFSATVGSSVSLAGFDLEPVRDGRLTVTLWWRCLAAMDRDYTAFVHLAGPGGLAAQADAQPGRGSYPTGRWEPGETIVDRFVLDVSKVGAGEYELVTGMYLLATGERLPVRDGAGRAVPGDASRLAGVRIP